MSHPLRRYGLRHAARPKPPPGHFDPVADIVVCLNQIVSDTARIYADLGQITGGSGGSGGGGGGGGGGSGGGGGGGVINWPSYTGVATPVGVSSDGITSVFYDASLGTQALTCAQNLVTAAPTINAANATLFAAKTQATNVIVFALGGATDGSGGADHMACDFVTGGNIEVCVNFANPSWEGTMYEAELSECMMAGNLCGQSNGEALSRWSAMVIANNAQLATFASAPVWASAGYPNWVDSTENSDSNYDSIGCGMAFISWMVATHGLKLSAVAVEMVQLGRGANTLSTLYQALTGTNTSPWTSFLAACKGISITTDDPFNALATATV